MTSGVKRKSDFDDDLAGNLDTLSLNKKPTPSPNPEYINRIAKAYLETRHPVSTEDIEDFGDRYLVTVVNPITINRMIEFIQIFSGAINLETLGKLSQFKCAHELLLIAYAYRNKPWYLSPDELLNVANLAPIRALGGLCQFARLFCDKMSLQKIAAICESSQFSVDTVMLADAIADANNYSPEMQEWIDFNRHYSIKENVIAVEIFRAFPEGITLHEVGEICTLCGEQSMWVKDTLACYRKYGVIITPGQFIQFLRDHPKVPPQRRTIAMSWYNENYVGLISASKGKLSLEQLAYIFENHYNQIDDIIKDT